MKPRPACERCSHFTPHYVKRKNLIVRTDCGECACLPPRTFPSCNRFSPRDEAAERAEQLESAAVYLRQIAGQLERLESLLSEEKE